MKTRSDPMFWPRMLTPDIESMTPESAKAILAIKFSKKQIAGFNALSARNGQGRLNDDERDALMTFVQMGNLLGLLHAKACHVLKQAGAPKRQKSA